MTAAPDWGDLPGRDALLAGPMDFQRAERAAGKRIFPPEPQILRALALTPLAALKVVILGQDPYHGAGQAQGLAFSVAPGSRLPPSLRNIFRELEADLGIPVPSTGDLEPWARQGVLLLNTVLTVEEGRAGSHRGRGWEALTDALIAAASAEAPPSAFLLWGAPAQAKAGLIDPIRHRVLTAPHPSPLSAHRGFFGSRPFSQANAFLAAQGRAPVDWRLPC
ncbi:MAG: uracil-DNA glycosylase [Amaricoccus sp.]